MPLGLREVEDERKSVCSQEYLVMPAVRRSDWAYAKEYSMPLCMPGQGHLLEKMWHEKRTKKHDFSKHKNVVENFGVIEAKATFINATTLKSQMARLGRHVELGLKKAQEDLEIKRNKLREAILEEDTALTHEYVKRAQKLADELYEEKKKQANDILLKHEQEREKEAKVRLEQLVRDNSEELKEKISIVKRLEAAEIQKHQICEKHIQLEREREFDNFWQELQKKRDEERIKYEEEEEKLRINRIKEQREILNKQILGKLMMKDEMQKIVKKEAAFIDKLRDQLKEEEEKEKEFKLKQKSEQMKIQKAQLEEHRLLKEEQEREQKKFDNYYVSMLNKALMQDNMRQLDTREQVRKEAEFFQKQLAEIKAAQVREEQEIEVLRAQEVKKKEDVIKAHQLALKGARDKLQRETLETWKQQVMYKQNKLEEERQAENLASKWSQSILEKNRGLDKVLVNLRKEEDIRTSNDLNFQRKYSDLMKKRQAVEEIEFKGKNEEEEKEEKELIKSFGTCFGPPHPFTKAILDNQ